MSSSAYGSRAKQTRPEPSQKDGFSALVDSNAAAASDADRAPGRGPDAPLKRSDADDARARTDTKTDAQPQPKLSAAADSKHQTPDSEETADIPATQPAPIVVAASGKTPQTGEAATVIDDTAATDDTAQTADGPAIPGSVAAATATLALVVPVATAVSGQAPIASDAQIAASAAVNPASAAAITAAQSAGTDKALADAATAATIEQPVEAASTSLAAETATAVPAPIAGKSKTPAASTKDVAGDDTQTIDASSTARTPDQIAAADAATHGTKENGIRHDKAEIATDTAAAPDAGKPASAAPAEHRAPAVAAPVQALQPDPGLQAAVGHQPQLQVQTASPAPATPIPQYNVTPGANTPVPLSGLAVDIALRAAGGSSRFEIRLDPAELGRIDVRLDIDKHGNVTSHLTVERASTLDMLRKDAPQLQQALQDAGLKTGDSGLQFSLRDQSSSGQNNDNGSGRNSQRLVITEDDTVPAQVAGRSYGRMLASSSGVDIRV
ncbi:MAG: flagellar hook-length control protein FliK [Pseudomonadota bacterium]